MISLNKTGKFIAELRKEKKLSQEQLGNMIPISRQAVSKWERGIALPDTSALIRLKEIFNVSIDEIFTGERFEKLDRDLTDNVTINMYTKYKKTKRFLKIAIAFLLAFLIYYFINSYQSVHVYTIYGDSENININNGIFVITSDKIYFSISNLISKNQKRIDNMELYYKINGERIPIVKQNDSFLTIIDYMGYNEYFDTKNIRKYLSNMYLDVTIDDNRETIQLSFKKDFTNDMLIFKKRGNSSSTNTTNNINEISFDNLIMKIKDKFKYEDESYIYELKDDVRGNYIVSYIESTNMLNLTRIEQKDILEIWVLDFELSSMQYTSYLNNDDNFIVEQSNSNYNFSNEKEKEFWSIIHMILNSN